MEVVESSDVPLNRSYASINDLPEEVFPYIFTYLDTVSLISCKRVCSSWREIIKYIENKNPNRWLDNCRREIPSWAVMDLIDTIYPTHWLNKSIVDWEVIFKCWYQLSALKHVSLTHAKEILPSLPGISCMKISGSWLLISTCQGRGKFVGYNVQTGQVLDIYKGTGPIEGFELVNSDPRQNASNTVTHSEELKKLFDTMDHNEVWLEVPLIYKLLRRDYSSTVDGSLDKYIHSNGYRAEISEEDHDPPYLNIVLNKINSKGRGPDSMEFEFPLYHPLTRDSHLTHHFWMDKISHIRATLQRGKVHIEVTIVNISTGVIKQDKSEWVPVDRCFPWDQLSHTSWHGAISITFTSSPLLIFQCQGRFKIQKTSLRSAFVSYGMLYCSHLFLGTTRGDILIYRLEKPADILMVEVHKTVPTLTAKVCNEKITKIVVVDQTNTSSKHPEIYCATTGSVYLVTFH